MTKNMIAIYSRKSKFTGKGESIENQIELCRQYIAAQYADGDDNEIAIYEDEGFSGGSIERPKFKQMMTDAKTKKFSAIVCYRLDRISRNIGDFAKLIEELNDLHVSFVSIKEQFDTSSPMGRAMMYIASVFSQLERETIAERIRDNMHELSKTGRWLGGATPTGYASEEVENVTVEGKVKKACQLKLIPEEATMVKQIFEKFIATHSLTRTETYLIQNDFKTKNGNRFTRFAVKNILSNPVYMTADERAYEYLIEKDVDLFAHKAEFDGEHGVMAYNRTIQKAGRANQVRDKNEWIVAVGKHRGLICGADWVKAQELLERNRSKSYHQPRSNAALLPGLLYCSNCGEYMRPKLSKRLNAQGEQIYSYLCTLKEKSCQHCCTMKNASGNILDNLVCEEITKLSEDSLEFKSQLEHCKKALAAHRDEYENNLDKLRNAFRENEREIHGLVNALTKVLGTAAEIYFIQQIDELHDKGEAIKKRIDELECLTAVKALPDEGFDTIHRLLSSFRDMFADMNVDRKREALRTLVKRVVWDGENAHCYLLGAGEGASIDISEDESEPLGENSK